MAVTAVNAMRHSADLAPPSAGETPRGSPTCSAHLRTRLCSIYHIENTEDIYISAITDKSWTVQVIRACFICIVLVYCSGVGEEDLVAGFAKYCVR